jgi:hypothetical protein
VDEQFHGPGEFRQADDAVAGQVADMATPTNGSR